jgi:anaerobic selenocysteine-containing dehydrogenase
MIHPEDAKQKGLSPNQRVVVKSRVGSITVQIKITDEVMPGVVSLPFGWGHNQSKTKLSIANQHAGANMNDIVDDEFYDQLSGSSALGGIPVDIISVKPE